MVRYILRTICCLALLASPLLATADDDDNYGGIQPRRLLVIFETSKVMKDNLRDTEDTLAKLFSTNLKNELHPYDDVAIWTVNDAIHAEESLIDSWEPEEAAIYTGKVCEFLNKQKFSKHASLAPIEPALSRIVKNSEHLTVLIFCDTESHIAGTPYDNGINSIIANTAATLNGKQMSLIIVLRSYKGQYMGSSVNLSADLRIPKFPAPPKRTPTVNQNTAGPVARAMERPAASLPPMIIVGTEAGTNLSLLTNTPPPRPEVTVPPPTATTKSAAVPVTPSPAPAEVAVTQPQPARLPETITQPTPPPAPSQPAPPAVATEPNPAQPILQAQPTVPLTNWAAATATAAPPNNGYLILLAAGLGALATALIITMVLLIRASRPRNSLITSSMYDNRHQPPPK